MRHPFGLFYLAKHYQAQRLLSSPSTPTIVFIFSEKCAPTMPDK